MKKLTLEEKTLVFGLGNNRFLSVVFSNKNNFLKIFKSKKILKNLEYSTHNLGLFSLAMGSSIFNFLENLNEYKSISKYKKIDDYQTQVLGKSESYVRKYNAFSDSWRPSVRFGAYPFRNSISFGLPWFY